MLGLASSRHGRVRPPGHAQLPPVRQVFRSTCQRHTCETGDHSSPSCLWHHLIAPAPSQRRAAVAKRSARSLNPANRHPHAVCSWIQPWRTTGSATTTLGLGCCGAITGAKHSSSRHDWRQSTRHPRSATENPPPDPSQRESQTRSPQRETRLPTSVLFRPIHLVAPFSSAWYGIMNVPPDSGLVNRRYGDFARAAYGLSLQ